jgi:PKD domain
VRAGAAIVVSMVLLLGARAGASPRWTTPAQLSRGDIALGPELAVGASGDALVVWDQEVGDVCPAQPANPACVHIVEAVSRAPGATVWPAATEVARPGIDSRPQAALDTAGNALVLWVHDIGEDRVLQASYRNSRSGAWPEPTDVSEITHRIGAHAAGLDAAGNATVVWAGTDSNGKSVVYAKERAAASGVWGGPIALSRPDGDAPAGPSLAVNVAGDAVAVWTMAEPTGRVVQASYRPAPSGVWSTPVDLSSAGAELDPAVAIDAAGDAIAVWSRGAVESAFRPAGGPWGGPVAVSPTLAGRSDPRVALDAAGNAVTVWMGRNRVQSAARSRSAATWSAPTDVSIAAATSPQLALDTAGNGIAVWVDAHGTTQAALRPAASGRWLPPVGVSATGATTMPRVFAGAAGSSIVAWNRSEAPRAFVEAADLAGAGPLLTNLSVRTTGTARVAIPFAVSPVPWASPLAGPPVWSFGDGASARGVRTSHVYAAPGRYAVTVMQADAAGGTAATSSRIAIAPPRLRNISRPSILGAPRVGAILTCARGSWAGTPPIRYAYRWLRSGRPIPGAASRRYRVRPSDTGALVACRVLATNVAGTTAATSRARGIIGPSG